MYRCATVSQDELKSLRLIENVVRRGRVLHIAEDRIVLEAGSIPTDAKQVHVDCTADGAPKKPGSHDLRSRAGSHCRRCGAACSTFNAALIAFVEAARENDVEKNRLCPTQPVSRRSLDWIATNAISQRVQMTWFAGTRPAGMDGALPTRRGTWDQRSPGRAANANGARSLCSRTCEQAVEKLESFLAETA